MIRKFRLRNALGEWYDLNDREHFFYNPSGLGHEYNSDYENIGFLHIKTEETLEQNEIKGKIRLKTYDQYHQLALFIQHKPLTLEYTAGGTYYMQIDVEQLEKEEISRSGKLDPSIRMVGLSPWYKNIRAENSQDQGGGKIYPYTYPYSYKDYASGELILQSDSAIQSPCRLILIGPCKNPSWSHYLNGNRTMIGKLGNVEKDCIIEEGKRVIIDDTGPVYSIKEYDSHGNMTRDLYGLSDFSTKRFIKLGYGDNRITYQHEESYAMNAIVEGRIMYAGV